MAITPSSYPFSGGAFMGGGGSPVNRDDIHTLNLTKNGESIGNYNPLIGDADVDVPSDAVVISFSTFSGTMPGSAYSKMASAVGAGQVVMLKSVSGASVVYWTLLAASVLSYKFISVSETAVLTVEIQTSGDSSGNHAFTISNVPLTELRVIDTGASSGDDRGHEHTRIVEALAAGKTVCIKYTSGSNIAYGTLCGAHDDHYTFIVDYGGTPSVLTVIADGSMQISAIFDGDASEFSVTPDGSSTGYNITGPTLLKVFLQKFKNLVGALKALAFKDNVSDSDISGTISNSHIASATTWNGKQDSLGISSSGDTGKFLNERGVFATPNYPSVPSVINNLTSDSTTNALSAAQGKALNDGKVNKTIQIGATSSKPWVRICSGTVNQWNSTALVCKVFKRGYADSTALSTYVGDLIFSIFRQNDSAQYPTIRQLYINSALRINNSGVTACILHNGSDYYELWISCTTNEGRCSILEEYSYNATVSLSTAYTSAEFSSYITDNSYTRQNVQYYGIHLNSDAVSGVGSPTAPVYVDPDGQVKPCTQGSTLKSNTATLYIAGYTDSNIPYYHVKDIKNGCVNHVDFSGITNSTCNITFEAPTLATGEEYDYVISLEGYNDNTGVSTGADVENCKQVLHYDWNNNTWTGEPVLLQATDWRQICVVRGTTCEWKRVNLS